MAEFEHVGMDLPDELIGARITLRPWRESDADAFFSLVDRSRESLTRWLPWPDAYQSVEDARPFLRRGAALWLLREEFLLGIFTHDGELLGSVGLHPRNWRVPSFEIGYWLGASFEGKGFMSEAVRLTTKFAFENLGANRVLIRCDVENGRSTAVARRCGYVLEGTFRNDTVMPPQILSDSLVFAMIPAGYAAVRECWTGNEPA